MPLDEPSLAIGALQADVKTLIGVGAVIDNKLSQVINSVAVINEKANKAHTRLDEILDPQNGLLTQAAANAAEAQETLKKGKWILMGVGGAGALSGTVFGTWLAKISAVFASTGGAPQ